MKVNVSINVKMNDLSNLDKASPEFKDKICKIYERDIKKMLKSNIVHVKDSLNIDINASWED